MLEEAEMRGILKRKARGGRVERILKGKARGGRDERLTKETG